MNKYSIARFSIGLLFWAQLVCGEEQLPPLDVTFEPVLSPPWLFHAREGGLYAASPSATKPISLMGARGNGGVFSFAAAPFGKSTLVAWIEKSAGGRRLRASTISSDGSISTSSELGNGISSSQTAVIASPQGGAYILDASLGQDPSLHITAWDETNNDSERVILDTGGLRRVNLFSALIVESHLYVLLASTDKGQTVIHALSYALPAMSLESSKVVAKAETVVFLESFVLGGQPAVAYKYQRDGSLGLSLAIEEASGWRDLPISATDDMDVARATQSTWADGRLLLVLSADDQERAKQRVYAVASESRGKTWDMQRIDTSAGTSTRAWLPEMTTDGDQVGVVWEDARDIRSAVRMQVSTDRGRTWLNQDIRLSDAGHYAIRPRIQAHADDLYVAWYQYRTDARKEVDPRITVLSWQDALAIARTQGTPTSVEDKKHQLRQAVADYWDAMVGNDLRRSYERHDPFYRARVPFAAHSLHRGKVIYHSYQIRDIQIDGNVAKVKLTTNFEVPKLMVMGREQSVPPRDAPIEDTWLYIHGEWYRQYIDALSGGSAVKY